MSNNTRIPFDANEAELFSIEHIKSHLQQAFGKRMTVTTADALTFAILRASESLDECRCYADEMPYDFNALQTRLARFYC
jgi:hypothetical protein